MMGLGAVEAKEIIPDLDLMFPRVTGWIQFSRRHAGDPGRASHCEIPGPGLRNHDRSQDLVQANPSFVSW